MAQNPPVRTSLMLPSPSVCRRAVQPFLRASISRAGAKVLMQPLTQSHEGVGIHGFHQPSLNALPD